MNIYDTMQYITEGRTVTENGGNCYDTTGSKVLDLFSSIGGMRRRSMESIVRLYLAAREENAELADKIVLYSRSIRGKGGLGERKIGRILLQTLAYLEPDKVKRNLDLIVENGRFDDLYVLEGTSVEPAMWYYMLDTFTNDYKAMMRNMPITLAAKWMKSINTSSAESRRLARKFCKIANLTEKDYRKTLSRMRKYLDITEVKMSAREWEKIDFSKVPSKAMNMYMEIFTKHAPENITSYLEQIKAGKKKVNAATLYPYEIIEKLRSTKDNDTEQLLEEQWKALPNYFKTPHNIVCCADVSGSMVGRPMATSIGLSLYCAERNQGDYNGLYLTFTDHPTFLEVDKNASLKTRVEKAYAHYGYNTNLNGMYEAIYKMTLKAKEAPECLVVISDGEIDHFLSSCDCFSIVDKWEETFRKAGYEVPKTIMWNVEARENHYIAQKTNPKISFVSGSSAGIFVNILDLKDYDGYQAMVECLRPYEWE